MGFYAVSELTCHQPAPPTTNATLFPSIYRGLGNHRDWTEGFEKGTIATPLDDIARSVPQMLARIPVGLVVGFGTAFLGYHIYRDVKNLVTTGCIPSARWEGCGVANIVATLTAELAFVALAVFVFYWLVLKKDDGD